MKFLIKETISLVAQEQTGKLFPVPLIASDTCEIQSLDGTSTITHRYGISTLPTDKIQPHIDAGHLVAVE